METPPLLKGYLYPSSRVTRCPRFHACIISKKCQTYDKNQLDCTLCERAVDPPIDLGGHIPEGEYYPDIQHAIKVVQDRLILPMAHPDQTPQSVSADIVDQQSKLRKSTEILERFVHKGVLQITDELDGSTDFKI